jgi:pSer/pThr/pTyr-binding forkhead associated (FHA) protein
MSENSNLQPVRVCDNCQHYNSINAVLCAQCNQPLTPATRTVSDSQPVSPPTQITSIANQDQGTVSLYIQGGSLPITIEHTAHIVLGRRKTPDDTFVTVDLASANAHELGVSRHHAAIHLDGETVTIEDLGSTNGSFIGDVRLVAGQPYPLHSGDEFRLGKMVILFVYYLPR